MKMSQQFDKPFTQQEALPEAAIERAIEILQTGRLHRYNTVAGEEAEASLLEREFAAYQGAKYCVACSSGGFAMQIALRSCGAEHGDKVLANAYTLAPVPGAINAAGCEPVFVEIGDDWKMDTEDFANKAKNSGARFLMLSHMRGHIGDMEKITEICAELEISMIEDCAHTMGARWKGERSGNFGKVACFSNQTYKHMNSGEGGFLTTDDDEIAARAIIHSGSYMLFDRHGTVPPKEAFDAVKLVTPNMSGRMDNLRAALLRVQLPQLDENIRRWNERYQVLEEGLRLSPNLYLPHRPQHEAFVGSSIQFQVEGLAANEIQEFVSNCGKSGVEIKWFGNDEPVAFTSKYSSWAYFKDKPFLPKTDAVLAKTCDLRVPLTFELSDCKLISEIICDKVAELVQ